MASPVVLTAVVGLTLVAVILVVAVLVATSTHALVELPCTGYRDLTSDRRTLLSDMRTGGMIAQSCRARARGGRKDRILILVRPAGTEGETCAPPPAAPPPRAIDRWRRPSQHDQRCVLSRPQQALVLAVGAELLACDLRDE